MLLKELLSVISGKVVLKIDGINLKYDDISMVPCKYLNYEIKKIGMLSAGLHLELTERNEEERFRETGKRVGKRSLKKEVCKNLKRTIKTN